MERGDAYFAVLALAAKRGLNDQRQVLQHRTCEEVLYLRLICVSRGWVPQVEKEA